MCEGENWSSPFRINVRAGWLDSQRGSSCSSIRRRRSSSCKGNRFGSSAKSLYICEKNRVCRDCKAKPFSQCPMKSNQVILFPGGFSLGSHTGHCACFVADRTEDRGHSQQSLYYGCTYMWTLLKEWMNEWKSEETRVVQWPLLCSIAGAAAGEEVIAWEKVCFALFWVKKINTCVCH